MASRKVVGLHKRPGSSFHWLTVMVPLPLRSPFHEGRSKYRMSLGTTDPAEARALALAKHAEFASRFQREKAQLAPAPQASVSPELADLLAQRASVRILALDDAVRYDPKLLRSFLAAWAPQPVRYFGPTPATEAEAADGMTPAQHAQLTRLHDMLIAGMNQALTFGQLKATELDCAAEAAKLGLAFDWSKNRAAVIKMAHATLGAWLQVVARNHGTHVETPAMPEPSPGLVPQPTTQPAKAKAGKALTLWDLCDLWGKGQIRDAQGKMRRALDKLEASGCPMGLDTLTVDHGHDFKDHIRATMSHATSKTQSDVLANVKALLNYAVKERRLIKSNPWVSVTIPKGKPTNRRGTWADEDLTKLFAAPLFQSYELPEDRRAGGPAAYWLPLLALHGGLRIAELTQLRIQDVVQRDGVLLLHVNEDSGKAVKSAAGVRYVPVHSNLIRLGFADFFADRKAQSTAPATPLFDALPSAPSRSPAEYASDSFRRFCQDVKVYQRWRDFHAFRTTLNSSLRAAEPALDSSLILGILGHEANDVNVKHYTVHKPAALRRAIESVSFQAAQALPRVYKGERISPSAANGNA